MQTAVNRGDPGGNKKVQCGFGRLPSRLPETPDVTFWMWNERRRLCSSPRTGCKESSVLGVWGSTQVSSSASLTSSPLSELVSVRAGSPPGWPQLRQLQPDLLQVVTRRLPGSTGGMGSGPQGIPISFLVEHSRDRASGVRRELSLAWLPRAWGDGPQTPCRGPDVGVSFRGQCAHRGHRAHPR